MTAAIEVRELDETSDPTPNFPSDTPPGAPDGDYRCEVCGDLLPPTPTGRKPRVMLCAEHKGTGKTKSATATKNRSHDKIAEGMTALHAMVGFMVGAMYIPTQDPVWTRDKDIINGNAERLGEAWAVQTDTDAKLRARINKFLDSVGTLSLAAAYAPLVVAIAANHTQNQASEGG